MPNRNKSQNSSDGQEKTQERFENNETDKPHFKLKYSKRISNIRNSDYIGDISKSNYKNSNKLGAILPKLNKLKEAIKRNKQTTSKKFINKFNEAYFKTNEFLNSIDCNNQEKTIKNFEEFKDRANDVHEEIGKPLQLYNKRLRKIRLKKNSFFRCKTEIIKNDLPLKFKVFNVDLNNIDIFINLGNEWATIDHCHQRFYSTNKVIIDQDVYQYYTAKVQTEKSHIIDNGTIEYMNFQILSYGQYEDAFVGIAYKTTNIDGLLPQDRNLSLGTLNLSYEARLQNESSDKFGGSPKKPRYYNRDNLLHSLRNLDNVEGLNIENEYVKQEQIRKRIYKYMSYCNKFYSENYNVLKDVRFQSQQKLKRLRHDHASHMRKVIVEQKAKDLEYKLASNDRLKQKREEITELLIQIYSYNKLLKNWLTLIYFSLMMDTIQKSFMDLRMKMFRRETFSMKSMFVNKFRMKGNVFKDRDIQQFSNESIYANLNFYCNFKMKLTMKAKVNDVLGKVFNRVLMIIRILMNIFKLRFIIMRIKFRFRQFLKYKKFAYEQFLYEWDWEIKLIESSKDKIKYTRPELDIDAALPFFTKKYKENLFLVLFNDNQHKYLEKKVQKILAIKKRERDVDSNIPASRGPETMKRYLTNTRQQKSNLENIRGYGESYHNFDIDSDNKIKIGNSTNDLDKSNLSDDTPIGQISIRKSQKFQFLNPNFKTNDQENRISENENSDSELKPNLILQEYPDGDFPVKIKINNCPSNDYIHNDSMIARPPNYSVNPNYDQGTLAIQNNMLNIPIKHVRQDSLDSLTTLQTPNNGIIENPKYDIASNKSISNSKNFNQKNSNFEKQSMHTPKDPIKKYTSRTLTNQQNKSSKSGINKIAGNFFLLDDELTNEFTHENILTLKYIRGFWRLKKYVNKMKVISVYETSTELLKDNYIDKLFQDLELLDSQDSINMRKEDNEVMSNNELPIKKDVLHNLNRVGNMINKKNRSKSKIEKDNNSGNSQQKRSKFNVKSDTLFEDNQPDNFNNSKSKFKAATTTAGKRGQKKTKRKITKGIQGFHKQKKSGQEEEDFQKMVIEEPEDNAKYKHQTVDIDKVADSDISIKNLKIKEILEGSNSPFFKITQANLYTKIPTIHNPSKGRIDSSEDISISTKAIKSVIIASVLLANKGNFPIEFYN